MARHWFNPSLGQRYVRTRPGLPQDVCFISEMIQPASLRMNERIVLSVELSTERLEYSRPELAAHIQSGYLLPPEEDILQEYRGRSLSDLLLRSTEEQRRTFRMRMAYVFALERADVGLSWKKATFRELVEATFVGRVHSHAVASETTGEPCVSMESEPPSPHTVYQWSLAYRASSRDLRSLAKGLLVVRKRAPRREPERRLLDAVLTYRRAFTGNSTVAQLTLDVNAHMSQTDPRHLDLEIERLYARAQEIAQANATLRKKSGVNRRSKKPRSGADEPGAPDANARPPAHTTPVA